MFQSLTRARIFLICSGFFIIGIGIASFIPKKILVYDIRLFIGLVFFLVLAVLIQNKKIKLTALIGFFLFFGIWRYAISLPMSTSDKIWYYNGQNVLLQGLVVDEPDQREKNIKYKVESKKLKVNTKEIKIDGDILVTAKPYPKYNYGDELEITCDLQTPKEFQGFAYDRYLARFDIYSVCYYPKVRVLNAGQGNFFYSRIFNIKDKLREIINKGLVEPEASLAKAIILGDKSGISDDLRERFAKTGISHVIAISGLHISILVMIVFGLLLNIGVSRKYTFYLVTILLIGYLFLIGLPASAMRAGLMGFLVLWALHLGRLNNLTNSLVLTGAILLFINPKLLRDDVGFQLSFLAVLGIALIYPVVNSWLDKRKVPRFKGVRDIIVITFAVQIFTLPIIISNFSIISIIAPISNLLILWVLPFLIVSLFVALGLGMILPGSLVVLFLPSSILIKYLIMVPTVLENIPFSYFEVGYVWSFWFVLYYFLIFLLIIRRRKTDKS